MTTNENSKNLIAALDKTVQEALQYFEGPGASSKARIGRWGVWEVLCHFILWHEATIEGMESASRGAGPYRMKDHYDVANERILDEYKGYSLHQLAGKLRELEKRLVKATNAMPNLDEPVMMRTDGTVLTGRQRLERISSHWAEHVEQLKTAEQS